MMLALGRRINATAGSCRGSILMFSGSVTCTLMKESLLKVDSDAFRGAALAWLYEAGELIVAVVHGNSEGLYLISLAAQLDLLAKKIISGNFVTLLRGPHFPVRGMVDEKFIREAVAYFAVKDNYLVIEPRFYPERYLEFACGTRGVGLEQVLRGLMARTVWIGEEIQITAFDDASVKDFERFLYARKI
jgi:hypothetical protein